MADNLTVTPQKRQRGVRWYALRGVLTMLVVLVALLGGAYAYSATILNSVTAAPATATLNSFDGSALLALSDADMVGTAYADGVLMQVAGQRDTLTALPLPLDPDNPQATEIVASNSVTSWPQVLVTSPSGERAYVIETAAEIPDDVVALPDILSDPPNGRSLTEVDLTSGETTVYDIMDFALHLDIDPSGQYLAVGSAADGEQLGIITVASLGEQATYRFFNIMDSAGEPAIEITSVNWHPTGDFLAVGIDRSELRFYEVITTNDGLIDLRPHGADITLGNTITYGQFTDDGRHYLTAEINWAAVPGQLGYVFNPPGDMIAIRFDATIAADHAVASRVAVGQSPEGFAVSPDGSLIVTVDMRRTYLPDALAFVPGTDLSSLSLLRFDADTGALTLLDQYGFEGVLPEHAAFDGDGDALAVVIYNNRDDPLGPGYIEFWNVVDDGAAVELERTTTRIPVTRGPHALALIPGA